MTEPNAPAVAPLDAAPVQDGDRESNVATAAELLHHATKSLVELVYPTSIRSEYRLVFAKLSENRFACILLVIILIFSVAEYEQPRWFPRPDHLSSAVIGFLGACTLIFPAFALFEYAETHSWPWEDEGFVWPWEALLWSSTVYNDQTFDESTLAFTHPQDIPTSLSLQAHQGTVVGDQGRVLDVASGGIKSSSTPKTSEKQDMVIPPTPFLPRGLRPAHLPSPTKHCSGLLGASPMPRKFGFINEKSELQYSEPEDKRAA